MKDLLFDIKVSIVIPIYKVEPYIEDCLRSVFDQTYRNLEIILVDDCTPDRSMLLAKSYVNNKGPYEGIEVKFLSHHVNKGLSAARNTGINAATGDYVYFLDSDDEITPDCMAKLTAPLSRMSYDFVIGEYKVVGTDKKKPSLKLGDGEIIGNDKIFHEYSNKQFYMMACGKLCNLQYIRNNSLFFKEGIIHEDNLWSLKLALSAQTMYAVRGPSYIYKVRQGSITEMENKKDKVLNFIPIIDLINQEINMSKGHINNDVYSYYDNLLGNKYLYVIMGGWEQEYCKLRKKDIRPYVYILMSSMKSKQYFRTHGHRLLPGHLGFNIYSLISRHL